MEIQWKTKYVQEIIVISLHVINTHNEINSEKLTYLTLSCQINKSERSKSVNCCFGNSHFISQLDDDLTLWCTILCKPLLMYKTLTKWPIFTNIFSYNQLHVWFIWQHIFKCFCVSSVIWLHQEETELDTKVKEVLFFIFSSTHCSLVIYLFASVLILYLSPSHFQNQVK